MITGIKARAEQERSHVHDTDATAPTVESVAATT